MDWLIRKTEPGGNNNFQRGLFESCSGNFGVGAIPSTDFNSPSGETSMASPALVDVGSVS